MNDKDPREWLKDIYFCPQCKESIGQARNEKVDADNNQWIKQVLEFYDKHKLHGFTLDN